MSEQTLTEADIDAVEETAAEPEQDEIGRAHV